MSDLIDSKPGTTFYVLGGFFLVWNLIGVMFFYQQMSLTPEIMERAGMTAGQMAWIEATPGWANVAYATAVIVGVLATVLLLLRRALALPAFILSFAGVIVQDIESFLLRNPMEVWGSNAYYIPAAVLVIAIVEILYTRASKAKGWLS